MSNPCSVTGLFLVSSQILMLLLVFSKHCGSKLFGKVGEIYLSGFPSLGCPSSIPVPLACFAPNLPFLPQNTHTVPHHPDLQSATPSPPHLSSAGSLSQDHIQLVNLIQDCSESTNWRWCKGCCFLKRCVMTGALLEKCPTLCVLVCERERWSSTPAGKLERFKAFYLS